MKPWSNRRDFFPVCSAMAAWVAAWTRPAAKAVPPPQIDHGLVQGADISRWNVGYCVMSSEGFADTPAGVLAAWETEKQVYFTRINPISGAISSLVAAPGATGARKYPAVAGNTKGETLLAWTEGIGWNKGGSVGWQVFNRDGKPVVEKGQVPGVPVWSLVAAFPRPDGGFTVVY